MLDVNVGDPLADEVELMRQAIPRVQGLTDLPLCIDSSVVEALEAGLGAYEGKALVNSVTGEDERLEAILPLVAKHGAAVIGLANDDEIPIDPERRLEVARKIVSVAGDHGIPPEDVLIDPLAIPVGAEPRAVTLFVETLRLIREHLGVNTTCGASNTSFGLPGRHTLGAGFLAIAASHGLTSAIADARSQEVVDAVRAADFLLGRDEWGSTWIARYRAKQAAALGVTVVPLIEEVHPDRVRLVFQQDDGATKEARVPAGTTLFDCASWNGVAIDSTCGGHGTCKKCKVRVASGDQPISAVDPRAFSPGELGAGWRLACRAQAEEDLVVEVPPLQTRPKAALAGVGRHVILRPAVQKRHLELSEPTLEDQTSDLERVLQAMDDVELRVPLEVVRTLGRTLRDADWQVTAVLVDDLLLDVEPGDTTARRHAIAFDLGTTTVVATLLDLETGQPLAVRSILNGQQAFGADVITRISATMLDPGALDVLRTRAHETLAQLTTEVCTEAGVEPGEVYEIVVAGNVTMIQLALGIDPEPLSMAPFTIAARKLPEARAADLGVAGARAGAGRALPGARRLRRARHRRRHPRDRADARPARPALHRRRHELRDRPRLLGACPRHGRARGPGVRGGADPLRDAGGRRRDRGVRIVDGEVELTVIGDVAPVGLCGSGLVDAVAELVGAGILDHSGRFVLGSSAAARQDRRRERLLPLRRRVPVPARRARAAVRQGLDRDRLDDPLQRHGHRAGGHLAGAARRLVRVVPDRGERGPDGLVPRLPLRASSPRGTSPARARRSPRSP